MTVLFQSKTMDMFNVPGWFPDHPQQTNKKITTGMSSNLPFRNTPKPPSISKEGLTYPPSEWDGKWKSLGRVGGWKHIKSSPRFFLNPNKRVCFCNVFACILHVSYEVSSFFWGVGRSSICFVWVYFFCCCYPDKFSFPETWVFVMFTLKKCAWLLVAVLSNRKKNTLKHSKKDKTCLGMKRNPTSQLMYNPCKIILEFWVFLFHWKINVFFFNVCFTYLRISRVQWDYLRVVFGFGWFMLRSTIRSEQVQKTITEDGRSVLAA